MVYVAVCVTALAAAALTFVSGFGLGTLLLPAFAAFFPLDVAVAATATVHLLNNIIKLSLVSGHIDRGVLLRFGVAAVIAAVAGALLQAGLSGGEAVMTWSTGGKVHEVTWIKLAVGAVIVGFAILELAPGYEKLEFDRRWLAVGGVLSGFFGGLSGHQGALRSAFLARCRLTKEAFVATGVASAVLIDLSRLTVYAGETLPRVLETRGVIGPVAAGSAAALIGTILGMRVLKKVTLGVIRKVVGAGLLVFGLAMGAGLV